MLTRPAAGAEPSVRRLREPLVLLLPHALDAVRATLDPEIAHIPLAGGQAVSYTHLDVYKRQGLFPRPVPAARDGDALGPVRAYAVGLGAAESDAGHPSPAPREAVLARGVLAWTAVFGAVSFELFGHYTGGIDDPATWFDQLTDVLAADLSLIHI